MSGLSLSVGGFGGTAATTAPQYGTASSYANGVNASNAAFGSGFTTPTPSTGKVLGMSNPTGAALWFGIAAMTGLVLIRRSLPN